MASDASTADASTADASKPTVYLEADDEIRGQKFVCLSFLTPNRGLLREKNHFFFSEFLKFYAMDFKVRATEGFLLGQMSQLQTALSDIEMRLINGTPETPMANLREEGAAIQALRGKLSQTVSADLDAFVRGNMTDFKESNIVESFEKYMALHRQRLEDEFHKSKSFQTSMHGLKIRGVYPTREQAAARAKALSKKDPYFNVYVADVGEWLPWDPEPDEVEESEYDDNSVQGNKLNELMKAYKENADNKNALFEEERRQKVAAAAEAALRVERSASAVAAAREAAGEEPIPRGQGAAEATADYGGVFESVGDLAIQRRLAARGAGGVSAGAVSDVSAGVSAGGVSAGVSAGDVSAGVAAGVSAGASAGAVSDVSAGVSAGAVSAAGEVEIATVD